MVRFKTSDLKGMGLKISMDGNINVVDRQIVIDDFKPEYIPGKGVFIPHEVRSSKNSKQLYIGQKILKDGSKKSIPRSTDSEAVKEYREKAGSYYEILSSVMQREFRKHSLPYYIEFSFVRSTHAEFDFANLVQLPQDMMVEYKWMGDDNVKIMVPVPPPQGMPIYTISKTSPGLWIKIIG